jgi:Lrp/AsnC family leucine-responsive transcriptional regulator
LTDLIENDVINLDQVDRDILNILQVEGRSSASYIAADIGMSIPAVTDRIKKLQESGVIMSFTALLDHRKVGLDVSAFITVISESSSHYNDVVRQANKTPEIVQCFTTTGNGSHVLLAITKNSTSLEKLLRIIQNWPGVTRTETQMVLSSYKNINTLQIPYQN